MLFVCLAIRSKGTKACTIATHVQCTMVGHKEKVTTCSWEFMKCFRAFVKCLWAFTRGSCWLHHKFVHVWFLVKLRGLCTNIHYPLEATSLQNTYIGLGLCGAVRPASRKWFCKSVNKDLNIHVVKGSGFAWISLLRRSASPCEVLRALRNRLQRIHDEFVTLFACYHSNNILYMYM